MGRNIWREVEGFETESGGSTGGVPSGLAVRGSRRKPQGWTPAQRDGPAGLDRGGNEGHRREEQEWGPSTTFVQAAHRLVCLPRHSIGKSPLSIQDVRARR